MKSSKRSNQLITTLALFFFLLSTSTNVFAHCDGLDGPVVKAAKKSLETGNINHVLAWIQKKDEAEIQKVFNQTLSVGKLSAEAKEMADMYFFETLVRIHRAGEGEPYTGLKPAGRDLGPIIPSADKAIISGSIEELKYRLNNSLIEGLDKRFTEVIENRNYDINKIEAGRKFVKAYVEFLHYSENLFASITAESTEHKH
jgi:hypothetical protein